MYAIVIFAFLLAIIGYGTLAQRAFHGDARDLAYSAALGIATLIVMGGILNALGLAYGPAIDVVLFGGVAIALALFVRQMASAAGRARSIDAGRRVLHWPAVWLVALCFAFTTFFFAPTQGYNPHDDMAQYLTRPYVMMSFGSIGANWFDSTGADSLGVQSWLLAFILRYLPLVYANALDAALMLSLTCALLATLGARLGASPWLTAAAILMFLMLNPSQVNVSAVYSMTLMMAGLAMALLRTAETYGAGVGKSGRWLMGLVPVGVFLAALPGLKATAGLWGVVFAIAFVFVAAASFATWREAIAAVAVVGASGAATVGLWLVPFLPLYRASIVAAREWPEQATAEPYCSGYIFDCWSYSWHRPRFAYWFSDTPAQHGQIGLLLTICCAIILLAVLQAGISRERKHRLAFPAIGAATVAFFLVAPALFPWGFLRYPAPIVYLTTCLAFLFVGAAAVAAADKGALRSMPGWLWRAALLVPMVAIVVPVAGDFRKRLAFAVDQRTSTQLARDAVFQTAVDNLFDPARRARIRALQARIPAGSTILAAIITPTDLDFERNPIFPHFHAALSASWWGDISKATPADIRRLLAKRGIDYVIWQNGGDWIYPEAELVEQATSRTRAIGAAASNALPLRRAVKAHEIGPTVFRGLDYTVFRVLESYDGNEPPGSDFLYTLGSPVNFVAGTDYAPYLVSGWTERLAGGVWSDGTAAVLRFDIERHPEQPLRLAAELLAFTIDAPPMAVTVEANGRRVAEWSVAGTRSTRKHSTYCATIPVEAVPDRTVSITFRIHNPTSPAEHGINADTRRLGILLKRADLSVAGDSEGQCAISG